MTDPASAAPGSFFPVEEVPASEEELSFMQTLRAYHLHLSPCRVTAQQRCENHPNCVLKCKSQTKGMGIHASISAQLAIFGSDPSKMIRSGRLVPCGIRNLGSTCFFNSFLQILFANTTFRAILFEYDGRDPIVLELQRLFSRMQNGRWKYIYPDSLVYMLIKNVKQQQDIHEFIRLFLTYMSHAMSESANKRVRTLIQDELRGSFAHLTCCKSCGNSTATSSHFFELSVPIAPAAGFSCSKKKRSLSPGDPLEPATIEAFSAGSIDLLSCMNQYFAKEVLDGNNLYYCNACHLKVKATRSVYLEALPPVLNIQLLRFVYDVNTHSKTKLATAVDVPMGLRFRQYQCAADEESPTSNVAHYDLAAIVSHYGATTNSGHYVVDIRDELSWEWFRMNDAVVDKIKMSTTAKDSASSLQWRLHTGGPWNELVYSSKNAYMLVYARRERQVIHAAQPLPALAQETALETEQFMSHVQWYKRQIERMDVFIRQRREMVKCVWKDIFPGPFAKDAYMISSTWLHDWTLGNPNKVFPEDVNLDDVRPGPIVNQHLVCHHGKLDPKQRHRVVRISGKAWKLLTAHYQYDVAFQWGEGEILCSSCAFEVLQQDRDVVVAANATIETRLELKKQLDTFTDLRRSRQYPSITSPPPSGTHFLIPESWRSAWLKYVRGKTVEPPGPIPVSALLCKHNKLRYSVYPSIQVFKDRPTCPSGIMFDVRKEEWHKLVDIYGTDCDTSLVVRVRDLTAKELDLLMVEFTDKIRKRTQSSSYRSWNLIVVDCETPMCDTCLSKPATGTKRRASRMETEESEQSADWRRKRSLASQDSLSQTSKDENSTSGDDDKVRRSQQRASKNLRANARQNDGFLDEMGFIGSPLFELVRDFEELQSSDSSVSSSETLDSEHTDIKEKVRKYTMWKLDTEHIDTPASPPPPKEDTVFPLCAEIYHTLMKERDMLDQASV